MNLELPDEQHEFARALTALLADRGGPAYLRALYQGRQDDEFDLWRRLGELGAHSLTVPEAHGGVGLPASSAVQVVETLGRFAFPQPAGLTLAAVVPVIAGYAPEADAQRYLPAIAAGELIGSVQDGWDGLTPWGAEAGVVLVLDGDRVHVAEPVAGGVTSFSSVDRARRLARLDPACVRSTFDDPAAAAELRRRATTVTAGELFGLAGALVERTVEYDKIRYQFDRPVGSFQAVQHTLADTFLDVETGRRTAWVAMMAIDDGDVDAGHLASVAKALASDAARRASDVALQLHGGIGYTWEHDLHFWLKRVVAVSAQFGSAARHWESIAERALDRDRA